MPAHLSGLNPAQRAAAVHGTAENTDSAGGGPLLIIAGAGSGKTNTLAHRVAHLVLSGADPGRILLLTFTRRAAVEMTRRTQRIVASARARSDVPVPQGEVRWSGTFHAIANRLL
ncbi:MAG: UvrD-helicase domain-containing protein, partial [Deltaproteobacteria bacterium]|nr:UvrD-helicase domain-containing protein [Deltaproteobacteria bacterium]